MREGSCAKTRTMECYRDRLRGEASTVLSELPPDLRTAFRLWQSSQTQLRVAFSGPIGLDYVAVKIVADAMGIDMSGEVLEGIQVIESTQLELWAEEDERRQKESEAQSKQAPGRPGLRP